jgi:hypothetical protein
MRKTSLRKAIGGRAKVDAVYPDVPTDETKGTSEEEDNLYNFKSSCSVGELATEPDFAAAVQEKAKHEAEEKANAQEAEEKAKQDAQEKANDSLQGDIDVSQISDCLIGKCVGHLHSFSRVTFQLWDHRPISRLRSRGIATTSTTFQGG